MAETGKQTWHLQGWAAAAALASAWLPGAAQAQTSTPPPFAAPTLPGNTARCIYDYLSVEDREMALLLFARESLDGGGFTKSSKNVQVVDRLIEEAHEKCLTRFAWSIGRSDAAKSYALTSILGEGLRQVLEQRGNSTSKVEAYFALNRAALARKQEILGADKDRLSAYLVEQGWDAEDPETITMAGLYLETLMLLDRTERYFAASGGTGRQTIRARPSRAKKAVRGRP